MITDGPTDYRPSARCIWIIENGDNSGPLVLKLNEFFTECCWDYLYVYDGDSVYDTQIAAFRYVFLCLKMFKKVSSEI